MSEQWPKFFRWGDEVISIASEHDVVRCREDVRWTYRHLCDSKGWERIAGPPSDHVLGQIADTQKIGSELTALRQFHAAVMQATQDASNAKLPHAIFQADDELSRVVPRVKGEAV
jgi:hypothetical protein